MMFHFLNNLLNGVGCIVLVVILFVIWLLWGVVSFVFDLIWTIICAPFEFIGWLFDVVF